MNATVEKTNKMSVDYITSEMKAKHLEGDFLKQY